MDSDLLSLFPLWYVAFLLSLTCHEASHALAAKWGGDLTAYHSGQVTLNPLPHIRREIFGTVIVPILTFVLGGWMLGWGSAPYDPFWEHRHPRRAAWMALAGPVANLILVLLTGAAILLGFWSGQFQGSSQFDFSRLASGSSALTDGFARFLSILFSLNLLLGVFNLLPVAPLDGHSVIGLLLPEPTFVRWLEFIRQPMPSLLGLLLAWRVFDVLFDPIYIAAVRTLYFMAG